MKNSTAMYYIVSAGRGVLYQLFPVEYNVYIFICIYKHVYEYAHSQVLAVLVHCGNVFLLYLILHQTIILMNSNVSVC